MDALGTLHHLIIRGIERRPIVDDDKDRENFVSRLGDLAAEIETGISAWTLMTNHAHILIKSGSFGKERRCQVFILDRYEKKLECLSGQINLLKMMEKIVKRWVV